MKIISFLTLILILFLIASSHVPSATAVPATRSQNLKSQHALPLSSLPHHQVKEEDEEVLMERRMDLETQDYGGTGANKDHDPKSPGKA